MYKLATIIFDSSGTLIDDSVTAWLAFKKFFNQYGISLSLKAFKEEFCLPCSDFLIKKGAPKKALQEFPKAINRLYLDSLDYTKPFPDVKECITSLRKIGMRIGVVSATPTELLNVALEKFGLMSYFEIAIGDASKPSPLPIFQACEKLAIHPDEQVAYVGDMEEDIICARKAGVTPIGICRDGSYHNRTKLESQNPRYMINDLRQLLTIV